jgi:transcriptional regulator with XRE-family HTH domain
MIPIDFNLRGMREAANLTQADLAKRLRVSQAQVLRYESEPENVPLRVLREWTAACGNVSPQQHGSIDVGKPYAPISERLAHIDLFQRGQPPLEQGDTIRPAIGFNELHLAVRELGRKPRLLLTGKFDGGKSRLANTLLGADRLPTAYRPTTSVVCLLRHISEKPAWQAEDVWIMRDGFKIDFVDDAEHCLGHRILAGDFETLQKVGSHPKEGAKEKDGVSPDDPAFAVAYVDSPILEACDILDTPGFGYLKRDTALSRAVFTRSDILVFLSPCTGFLSGQDLHSIAGLLEAFPTGKEVDPLRRFAVLATHAHHNVHDSEVDEAIDAGLARMARELRPQLRQVLGEEDCRDPESIVARLRPRFFPWYVDIDRRRKPFEDDLRELLGTLRPSIVRREVDGAVVSFKEQSAELYGAEIEHLKELIQDHDNAKEALEALQSSLPEHLGRIEAKRQVVEDRITLAKNSTRDFIETSVKPILKADDVKAFIEARYQKSEDAEKHAATAIEALIRGRIETFVEGEAKAIAKDIDDFLGEYSKPNFGLKGLRIAIPFDGQGAFLGALAAGTAYGALALWAALVAGGSNLGAYILVAKVAGLLSMLGISFTGGAAGATALVAALGGPITVGAAIAIAIGYFAYSVFGRSWQSRLADQIVDQFTEAKVIEKFRSQLDELWDQTLEGFKAAADKTREDYQAHTNRLIERLQTPRDVLEARLARVEARRLSLSMFPWTPLSQGGSP